MQGQSLIRIGFQQGLHGRSTADPVRKDCESSGVGMGGTKGLGMLAEFQIAGVVVAIPARIATTAGSCIAGPRSKTP